MRRIVSRTPTNEASSPSNLLYDNPPHLPEELFQPLLQGNSFRVERIVSQGHASPEGFWYDQDENEWVLVLQGKAILQFKSDAEPVELRQGSYLNIPARVKHRVISTDPHENTVWLAIHYRD